MATTNTGVDEDRLGAEIASVAADLDWRQDDIPSRSAQFAYPLRAVRPGPRRGTWAAAGSLLHVEPADAVHLGALKAAGNPLPAGKAEPSIPPRWPCAWWRRPVPTPASRRIDARHAARHRARRPARGAAGSPAIDRAQGYQVTTVLARLELPKTVDHTVALGPEAEAAQPLYARYWLHNRGPAPLGGLPAVAHLHPQRATAPPGGEVTLRLTAVGDCTDATLTGTVVVVCPDGWSAAPTQLPFLLEPGEHREAVVALAVPVDAAPGLYPVRAKLRITGQDVPPTWCQPVEDVCIVQVGADPPAELA